MCMEAWGGRTRGAGGAETRRAPALAALPAWRDRGCEGACGLMIVLYI